MSIALLGFVSWSEQPKWVSIFDGKTLDGWTPKIKGHALGEDPYNTFRVEGGAIVVRYDKYDGEFDGRFGHLFFQSPFANYELRLEYRFIGEQVKGGPGWAWRNSGVMFHGQSANSIRVDQDFPVSMEFQFLGGDGSGARPTGNLCTPGTNYVQDGKLITQHCTNSKSPTLDGDQWVRATIEVHGRGVVRHYINGQKVMEYDGSQLDPSDADAKALIKNGDLMIDSGTISLQSESHPIEFRKIEIMELD